MDAVGNIYIADSSVDRIRKVNPDGTITTVAGNGSRGFSGDGGPATSASLRSPGLAVDAVGNLYIADAYNNRIRKVGLDGIISTVAGSGPTGFGNGGFSGDSGPATSALLNLPFDVASDVDGNLYIADSNNRIRKVSLDGMISTVAGNGNFGFSGDGGPATSASLRSPEGMAVDAVGNLYIADSSNLRIRKVNPDGIITTVAGNGTNSFSGDGGPATSASMQIISGVAVNRAGDLYIAGTFSHRIRKVSPDGIINTVAGNGQFRFAGDSGPATSASLNLRCCGVGVTVDAAGNLYIADGDNFRVRRVSPSGIITTVAGNGIRGFSGDGGPATSALLNRPHGVALDAVGNRYIADDSNRRIRKVSPDGIITTVAGNGTSSFSIRDGELATTAQIALPSAVAVDAAGNLYIAANNNRIRKVSPDGIITTIAGGNGCEPLLEDCFLGDGGPAISASLNSPKGVAVDSAGNLYISDTWNNRIRKVTPDGIINTVAGSGAVGQNNGCFSGDDGPAINALINPGCCGGGIAVDALGSLYIADTNSNRIRKVSPDGIITTVAGNGQSGFSGDGGPATNASLNFPEDVAVDAVGNLYIADKSNDRIRKVLATPLSFTVFPQNLNFSAQTGAPAVAAQRITVSSAVAGLRWSTLASTQTGGNWLSVSPSAGTAPSTIDVRVDVASLSAGIYQGTVTVDVPGASPPTQAVSVELTVTPALPAELAVEPSSLTLEGLFGDGSLPIETLRISNAGGGTLDWTAQASTVTGGNWLSVSQSSGPASAASPTEVQVAANLIGLAPAVYSGSIVVESPESDPKTVAVTLLVSEVTATILVSQSALLFTGVEGGRIVPSQTFGILNTKPGTMNWTVGASTLGGGNWLTVSPESGSSTAGSLEVPLVDVGLNVGGLGAGQYSGQIRVSAQTANNSPQFVTVTLNVLPAGSIPPVVVRPTGLIFVRQAGSSSPGSQTVRLATAAPGGQEAVARPITFQGGEWLEALPSNLVFSPDEPRNIVVQPTLGSLPPGEYFGALTLGFLSDRSSQNVNVLFVVTPAGAAPAGVRTLDGNGRAAQQECVAQRLFVTGRSLGNNFASRVAWPSRIAAQVKDDCDNTVHNATVVARFSNGDPLLALVGLGNGLYENTWRPVNAGSVRINVRAERASLVPDEVRVDGQVTGNTAAAPALFTGGIVNAASFAPGEALAPGSIVSVFGSNLAQGVNLAEQVPLGNTLGGTTLIVGGLEQLLFFSSGGQINAQLPFDLTPNSRPQMVVRVQREGGAEAISVPETITIAEARPAIFTTNQQGTGQGAILNQDFSPNSAENPEAVGNVIQVFSTGLGNTDPSVPSGQLAPSQEPLARVLVPVQAQIGGHSATVHFAGLAPGFVGLYQVNVQIPAGVTPGPEVPLVLFQNGVPSNTVTVAVQ